MSENKNTTYQSLWDSAKAVFRGKFIPITAILKKEIPQVGNLTSHLKKIEK